MKRLLDPLLILRARAEARALLYRAWEIDNLEAAVQPLLDYAGRNGLTKQLGEAVILAVIRHAFDSIEEADGWRTMWTKPFDRPELT